MSDKELRFPAIRPEDILSVQPMTAPLPDGIKFTYRTPTPEEKERDRKHSEGSRLCHDHFRSPERETKYDTMYEAGPCPFCGTMIKYMVSSYNGHFRASCQTGKCFSFIE
jgi:hypothetical protein